MYDNTSGRRRRVKTVRGVVLVVSRHVPTAWSADGSAQGENPVREVPTRDHGGPGLPSADAMGSRLDHYNIPSA
jgi:hypothetical protein